MQFSSCSKPHHSYSKCPFEHSRCILEHLTRTVPLALPDNNNNGNTIHLLNIIPAFPLRPHLRALSLSATFHLRSMHIRPSSFPSAWIYRARGFINILYIFQNANPIPFPSFWNYDLNLLTSSLCHTLKGAHDFFTQSMTSVLGLSQPYVPRSKLLPLSLPPFHVHLL